MEFHERMNEFSTGVCSFNNIIQEMPEAADILCFVKYRRKHVSNCCVVYRCVVVAKCDHVITCSLPIPDSKFISAPSCRELKDCCNILKLMSRCLIFHLTSTKRTKMAYNSLLWQVSSNIIEIYLLCISSVMILVSSFNTNGI